MISFKSGSGSSMFIYMFSKQLYKKSTFIILSGSKFFKPKHYFSSFFIRGKENIIQIKLFYHSKISRELNYLDNHKVHLCKLRRVLTKGQKNVTQNIKFQFYYHFKVDTCFHFSRCLVNHLRYVPFMPYYFTFWGQNLVIYSVKSFFNINEISLKHFSFFKKLNNISN